MSLELGLVLFVAVSPWILVLYLSRPRHNWKEVQLDQTIKTRYGRETRDVPNETRRGDHLRKL